MAHQVDLQSFGDVGAFDVGCCFENARVDDELVCVEPELAAEKNL